jgi:hypothetical protein
MQNDLISNSPFRQLVGLVLYPEPVWHLWPGSNDFTGAHITIQCHQVVLVVELAALSGRKAMRSDTEPGITRWPFIYGVPSHYNNHHFLHETRT